MEYPSDKMEALEKRAEKCFTKSGKANMKIIKRLVEEIRSSCYSTQIQRLEGDSLNYYRIRGLICGTGE